MALMLEKIEALAPDQASLAAAVKIKPSAWPLLAIDIGQTFAWGECQGSGSTPYRVCLQIADLGYKCSCPSRKFPCKHSLGLMLQLTKAPQNFKTDAVPDWVNDWAGRRRTGVDKKTDEATKPRASLDAALNVEPEKPKDEKAEARAAQQRERLKAQREETILAGLDELDRWIEDCLNRGLANFMGEAAQHCRTLAQRLVDAKAPALATAVDALPSQLLALPEQRRNEALIEALGEFHLLAQAYRRQDKLPELLRHDVRRLVGWTMDRQALLDDSTAMRVEANWTVIGTYVEIQPDKLRRIETWLIGVHDSKQHSAVLIDYVPFATAAGGSPFIPGETFSGQLVYFPSATPLRAIITERRSASTQAEVFLAVTTPLVEALDHYDDLQTKQPWLRQWPITVSDVTFLQSDNSGLWLTSGETGIPIAPKQFDESLVLGGVGVKSISGLWDGRYFVPFMADTALGLWFKQ
jgi:uncharacterized Zn finger protein